MTSSLDPRRLEKGHSTTSTSSTTTTRQHTLENATLPKAEQTDPRVLLILDDVISEREASGSHALQTLFVTGRHLKVCVILATQHVTSRTYPPVLRNNTDVVICFAQQSSEDAVDIAVGIAVSAVDDGRGDLA